MSPARAGEVVADALLFLPLYPSFPPRLVSGWPLLTGGPFFLAGEVAGEIGVAGMMLQVRDSHSILPRASKTTLVRPPFSLPSWFISRRLLVTESELGCGPSC